MKKEVLMALATFSGAVAAPPDDLALAKEALAKWVETRRLISLEKQQWTLEREMLDKRIELMQSERDALVENIKETEHLIADADRKHSNLMEENEALKSASTVLEGQISDIERGVLKILPALPPPVQRQVKPLSRRIPETAETALTLSERYQNVIGIVNELNKRAGEITVVSEVRELPDGDPAEMQTLYLGYAQAFYFKNRRDNIAGVGHPTGEGWVWEPNNNIAAQVADSVSILKNEKVAEFVLLPLGVEQAPKSEKNGN